MIPHLHLVVSKVIHSHHGMHLQSRTLCLGGGPHRTQPSSRMRDLPEQLGDQGTVSSCLCWVEWDDSFQQELGGSSFDFEFCGRGRIDGEASVRDSALWLWTLKVQEDFMTGLGNYYSLIFMDGVPVIVPGKMLLPDHLVGDPKSCRVTTHLHLCRASQLHSPGWYSGYSNTSYYQWLRFTLWENHSRVRPCLCEWLNVPFSYRANSAREHNNPITSRRIR